MTWRYSVLALAILATSVWAGGMLRRLNGVRAEVAAMRAVPAMRPAGGDAAGVVRGAVHGAGVTPVRLAAGRRGGVAYAELTLAGPEPAVRRAIGRIEAGARFGSWRMTPEPGSADRVRFEAVAYAVPGVRR